MASEAASRRGRNARERILATAGELFYREGIRAVGVDRIVAESGVAKASLYSHFRSKDELVATWLQRRDAEWMAWLEDAVERRGDQLLTVFDALGEWFSRPDFRGCAFLNSQAEVGASNALAAEAIVAHKRALRRYLARLAEAEGHADPERLAGELLVLVEGAIVTAAIDGDPGAAEVARGIAEQVLAARR